MKNMKKRSLLTAACVSVVSLAFCLPVAADVTGKWKADFTTPDGTARSNTFTFKTDGDKVTGMVAGTQDETPIQNGKITGDQISFIADRPFGKFTYTGKITGSEIKFKVSFGDQDFEMTAKKI